MYTSRFYPDRWWWWWTHIFNLPPSRAGPPRADRSRVPPFLCNSNGWVFRGPISGRPAAVSDPDARHPCALSVLRISIRSCITEERRKINELLCIGYIIYRIYLGNFCTGLIIKLSNVSLPLCSRAFDSRNRENAGRWLLVVRMASRARVQLLTNSVYASSTDAFENFFGERETKHKYFIQ